MAKFDDDRDEVLRRAREYLEWIVVVGDDLPASRAACDLSGNGVYAIVGFHPYNAASLKNDTEQELRKLIAHPGTVGIGEIGLDYFNEFCPRALQRPAFERQLALALELDKPVVIHCRAAEADTLAILRTVSGELKSCVMHCFGGDVPFAEQCLELGCYISFAGNVTYPKAIDLQAAARIIPIDRLLVETDAPYLAPQCHRGKRCEPAYVVHTLNFIAELRGTDNEELGAQVVKNAHTAFHIPNQ